MFILTCSKTEVENYSQKINENKTTYLQAKKLSLLGLSECCTT